jgi:hypothetical protein
VWFPIALARSGCVKPHPQWVFYFMEHHFNIDDAIKYGLHESIILNNIRFWVKKNQSNKKHFYNGFYWTYNSINAFCDLFPYLSYDQIRRSLENLQKNNAIGVGNFNQNPYDKTKWYCVLNQTDMATMPNRNGEDAKPIPYNKPNNKKTDKKHAELNNSVSDFNLIKKDFLDWYKYLKKVDYYFTGKDGAAIKQIINKIQFQNSGAEIRDDFRFLLKNINDQWINENLSLSLINSKFNEILSKIKNGNTKKQSESKADTKRILEQYFANMRNQSSGGCA